MKTRLTALLLIVSLLMFAGCAASTEKPQNESVNETITDTTVTEEDTAKQPESETQEPSQTESDTTDVTDTTDATDTTNTGLTEDDALTIALNDAGLTKDDISSNWWAEYELDDGIPEYEVEFYADNTEYDYTIHAETGEILSRDQDTEHLSPASTSSEQLTEDDAIAIALSAAELTEADVTNLHVEYDAEDGDYDVEFRYNNKEYAYEIHAATGDIHEREIDND